jgi:DNA invertase Pin-like site-specific DNA recombinase
MGVSYATWGGRVDVYDYRMVLPLDGYIRVSQVAGRKGDRFQSPGAQRSSIEGWAKAHGVKIAMIHEDLDRSGGTMDRPGMNEALRRIEAGASGGLVVARLDRFARTVIGGLTTIHDLHDRGARVVSVAENLDPATPMGRAMLGLLLIMAEWQRDQANEHLAAAQIRAAGASRRRGQRSSSRTSGIAPTPCAARATTPVDITTGCSPASRAARAADRPSGAPSTQAGMSATPVSPAAAPSVEASARSCSTTGR